MNIEGAYTCKSCTIVVYFMQIKWLEATASMEQRKNKPIFWAQDINHNMTILYFDMKFPEIE